MTPVDYALLSARVLRRRPAEPRSRPTAAARDVGIGVVAQAIAARARRRLRRVFGGATILGAAAAVALAVGLHAADRMAPSATSACPAGAACAPRPTYADDVGDVGGRLFRPGQFLVSLAGQPKVVAFAKGTRITLEHGALEYRQGAATRRFGLERGAVHLHVAKLTAGQRFLVETPDAEVEVRGTVFNVAVADDQTACTGSHTRVSVEQGIVEVRSGGRRHVLLAGQSWPPPCPQQRVAETRNEVAARHPGAGDTLPGPRTGAAHGAEPSEMPATRFSGVESSPGPASPPPRPAAVSSALAEQNDLFGRASEAQRLGRTDTALAHYGELLARFPSGPLTEAALVERMRLLRRTDPARAKSEAQTYLDRYPGGFARSEAEAIVLTP
jgi:hypothetical protein